MLERVPDDKFAWKPFRVSPAGVREKGCALVRRPLKCRSIELLDLLPAFRIHVITRLLRREVNVQMVTPFPAF